MAINKDRYLQLVTELQDNKVSLVAVSKTKPVQDIMALYQLGHRDFGENYVQELVSKQAELPQDIRWHFIGHLQSNKVKYIAPFVYLVHGVDSEKLLLEINKQGVKAGRVIPILLQVHIAAEETKFGFDTTELTALLQPEKLENLKNARIAGMMGMASFTSSQERVHSEFEGLKQMFDHYRDKELPNADFNILSMGMSGDYTTAILCGSNMVRIGSLLFGNRG